MQINIEHYKDSFNFALASREGAEPFLTVKGCRIKEGGKGRFVSGPATKSKDSDKWFNFTFMSDKFQQAVIAEYDATVPKASRASAAAKAAGDGFEADIPF